MRKILTMAIAAASLAVLAPAGVPDAKAQVYVEGGVYYDPYDRYDRYDRYRYGRYDRYDRRYYDRYPRYNRGRYYRRVDRAWDRHVRRCLRAYRSYDPWSDTYINRWGHRVRCRL